MQILLQHLQGISTHAPAGGATIGDAMGATTEFIFLLTPLREGRPAYCMLFTSCLFKFLLTPQREGRPGGSGVGNSQQDISTHAPAGGATFKQLFLLAKSKYFYSRPCGRGDKKQDVFDSVGRYVYSRPCGRGDQYS